jgi:hypothetical protein
VGSYLVAPSEDDEEDAVGDIVVVVEVVDDLGMMMMMMMMMMMVVVVEIKSCFMNLLYSYESIRHVVGAVKYLWTI